MNTTEKLNDAVENAKRLGLTAHNLHDHLKPLAQAGHFDSREARTLREMVAGLLTDGERLMKSIDTLVLAHLKPAGSQPTKKEKAK